MILTIINETNIGILGTKDLIDLEFWIEGFDIHETITSDENEIACSEHISKIETL